MKRIRKYSDPLNTLEPSGRRFADPERLLFLAVVAQSVIDATREKPSRLREQARNVIFSSVGVTCCHFRAICDWAGIEPGFVVRFTRHAIAEGISVPQDAISTALNLGYGDEDQGMEEPKDR